MGRRRVSDAEGGGDRRRHAARRRADRRHGSQLGIIELDGRWHLAGTVTVKITGRDRSRRIRRSTGLPAFPETLDAAHEVRRQVETEARDELLYGIAPSVPLAVAVEAYINRQRQRVLNSGDVERLREIKSAFPANRKVNRIADAEWTALVDQRMAGNAPVTRERYIDTIMAWLAWCRKKPRSWLAELPAFERDKAARYRPQRKHRRVGDLRPELIGRLIAHAPAHLRGQVAILWSTGHRVSSLLYGCRLCDYLAAPGREQITFHNTKNGRDIVAAVHPYAAMIMAEYLAWRGRLHDREAPLFLTDRRVPYRKPKRQQGGQMKTAWRHMIDAAGRQLRREALTEAAALRGQGREAEARSQWLMAKSDLELLAQLTPHWFRHRLATVLARDPVKAMEQGGWEDYRSWKGYTHDVPAERRALVAEMEAPPLRQNSDSRPDANRKTPA